jgi:hypothetical protein
MERFEELRKKILPVLLPYGVKRIALFGSTVLCVDWKSSVKPAATFLRNYARGIQKCHGGRSSA